MKIFFLFFVVLVFFLTSCSRRYMLFITGTGTTQPKTTQETQPQVVTTTQERVVTQPQVVYATTQQVVAQQPRQRRGGIRLSFQYGQSQGPYGQTQTIGGGISIGGVAITGVVGNGYQQPYYGTRNYYNQFNPFNSYRYDYNYYYQPRYDQYGRLYQPGSNPGWYYTQPPQYGGW